MEEYCTSKELERFNSKWKLAESCHIWQGPLDKDGYGTFHFRRINRRAHRVAWYMAHGAIEDGHVIDHKCRNRACVNTEHLRSVTRRENTLTNSLSVAAINALKKICKQGHAFDRVYGKQRYCSTCQSQKAKRLRYKWRSEDTVGC